MLIQKLIGLVLALLGVLSIYPTHDITFAVFAVPLGLYVMFTKKNVTDFKEGDE